ncbi:MAG: hypothetical protein EOP82_21690 [Variovorax sp.]|nr:MAG: hypothetical protein EOP82_21690 [Variovorax sp.]
MAYGKYRDGPNSIGRQAANWMQDDEETFKTRRRPGVLVRKTGEFTNIFQEDLKDPYLWGYVVLSSDQVRAARLEPETGFASRESFQHQLVYGPGQNFVTTAVTRYVGDGFILQLLNDGGTTGDVADPSRIFWPTLVRASGQREEFPGDGTHAGESLSFYDQARIAGLGALDGPAIGTGGHSFALFASGWGGEGQGYRFGMTALYFSDPAEPTTTRVPVMWAGSTRGATMAQRAYPYFPDRDHCPFTSFVAGPGKVQALHFVTEDTDEEIQIDPYLALSSDHGDNWTSAAATFLVDCLYEFPAAGSDRIHYDNGQMNMMGRYATIIYVGNDTTLLIVPNAYVDGELQEIDGEVVSGVPPARFCPALFVGHNGSYTRQAWPCDDWYTDRNGAKTDEEGDAVLLAGVTLLRTGQFGLGPGRAYIPVFQDGAIRVMLTEDYGASWAFSPPVPPEILSTYSSSFCGVISRAPTETGPAHVVFPAPDYVEKKMRFTRTRDLFQTFEPFGGVKAELLTSPAPYSGDYNYSFVNYGGKRHRPAVFPAYPGVFDKP